MKVFIVLLVALSLTSCAKNFVRVTEYGASSLTSSAGGCMVSSGGEPITGTFVYQGETCAYQQVQK